MDLCKSPHANKQTPILFSTETDLFHIYQWTIYCYCPSWFFGAHLFQLSTVSFLSVHVFFSLAVSYNVCFWRTFQVYTVGYCRVISYASFLCDRFRHNRNIVSGMPHRCQRWLLRIDFRLLKLEFRQQPAFILVTNAFHVVFIWKPNSTQGMLFNSSITSLFHILLRGHC